MDFYEGATTDEVFDKIVELTAKACDLRFASIR